MTTCLLSSALPKERESHVSIETHPCPSPKCTTHVCMLRCTMCLHVYMYDPMCACICSGVCSWWSTVAYYLKERFSFHWRIDRWTLPWRRTFLAKTSSLELSVMQLLVKWHPWRFKLFQKIIIILKSTWSQFCLQIRASEPKANFWVEIDTQRPSLGNQNSSFY